MPIVNLPPDQVASMSGAPPQTRAFKFSATVDNFVLYAHLKNMKYAPAPAGHFTDMLATCSRRPLLLCRRVQGSEDRGLLWQDPPAQDGSTGRPPGGQELLLRRRPQLWGLCRLGHHGPGQDGETGCHRRAGTLFSAVVRFDALTT